MANDFISSVRGTFDPESTAMLSAAFDKAWATIEKSGSPLAALDRAATTRELLAQRIIADAQAGESNPQRLAENALAHVASVR
jgi:hypothetical protein